MCMPGLNFISIHASRGGSDSPKAYYTSLTVYFNPRFPRGKRHASKGTTEQQFQISIHASRGGSDKKSMNEEASIAISIHASRGGSDILWNVLPLNVLRFQSTLPAGEATLMFP